MTFIGELIEVAVEIGGETITAEASTRHAGHDLAIDMPVTASWDAGDTLVFPGDARGDG